MGSCKFLYLSVSFEDPKRFQPSQPLKDRPEGGGGAGRGTAALLLLLLLLLSALLCGDTVDWEEEEEVVVVVVSWCFALVRAIDCRSDVVAVLDGGAAGWCY